MIDEPKIERARKGKLEISAFFTCVFGMERNSVFCICSWSGNRETGQKLRDASKFKQSGIHRLSELCASEFILPVLKFRILSIVPSYYFRLSERSDQMTNLNDLCES